jgi:uncharacterized protein
MKRLFATVALTLTLVPFASSALAAAPSPESIEKLLLVTKTDKMIDSMLQGMESMMTNMAEKSRSAGEDTAEAKAVRAASVKKLMPIMKEELSFEKLKSMYVQIYSESFTQEEIDGLVAFYNSPAGIAFVNKMPMVMQRSMTLTQERMGPMMQKIEQAMKKLAEETAASDVAVK